MITLLSSIPPSEHPRNSQYQLLSKMIRLKILLIQLPSPADWQSFHQAQEPIQKISSSILIYILRIYSYNFWTYNMTINKLIDMYVSFMRNQMGSTLQQMSALKRLKFRDSCWGRSSSLLRSGLDSAVLRTEPAKSQFEISFISCICTWNPKQPSVNAWLCQLDDSKSLYRKWLFHQTSIVNWLFGVPRNISIYLYYLYIIYHFKYLPIYISLKYHMQSFKQLSRMSFIISPWSSVAHLHRCRCKKLCLARSQLVVEVALWKKTLSDPTSRHQHVDMSTSCTILL